MVMGGYSGARLEGRVATVISSGGGRIGVG